MLLEDFTTRSSDIGWSTPLFLRDSSIPLIAFKVSMVLCCFLFDSIEQAVFFSSSISYSIWFCGFTVDVDAFDLHDNRGFLSTCIIVKSYETLGLTLLTVG